MAAPVKQVIKHLSEEETNDIMRYVSFLVQHLNLQEWTVLVSHRPTAPEDGEPPDVAVIHSHDLRYCAVIQVCPSWTRRSPEVKRETLLHEMLHLMTKELRIAERRWTMAMEEPFRGMAFIDISNNEERLVDRLASSLAPHLPQYPGPLTDPMPTVRRESDWC